MAGNNEYVSLTDVENESKMNLELTDDNDNMMKYLCNMQAMLEVKFNEIKSDSDAKFNIQNNKFDELKREIQELNECCKNTHEIKNQGVAQMSNVLKICKLLHPQLIWFPLA